jgi:hypothetical protein
LAFLAVSHEIDIDGAHPSEFVANLADLIPAAHLVYRE